MPKLEIHHHGHRAYAIRRDGEIIARASHDEDPNARIIDFCAVLTAGEVAEVARLVTEGPKTPAPEARPPAAAAQQATTPAPASGPPTTPSTPTSPPTPAPAPATPAAAPAGTPPAKPGA